MADDDLIDPVEFVKNLFSNNYSSVTQYTTNSDIPTFANGYFQKKWNIGNKSGAFFFYSIIEDVKWVNYAARRRKDIPFRLAIDLAFKSRRHMLSNARASRMILEAFANVRSVTPAEGYINDYNLLYEVAARDKTNKFTNFHRYIIDVELTTLGKETVVSL